MSNAAANIIRKCGGPKVVADLAGVDVSNVHRWTYPKSRGGTGGLVPARHQSSLLNEARKRGIPLEPSDFFEEERPPDHPPPANASAPAEGRAA